MAHTNLLNQLAGSVAPQGRPFNAAQSVAAGQELVAGNERLALLRSKLDAQRTQEARQAEIDRILQMGGSPGEIGQNIMALDPKMGLDYMKFQQTQDKMSDDDAARRAQELALQNYAASEGLDPNHTGILMADPANAFKTIQGNILTQPDPAKAPETRNRYDGANVIQEEFIDGKWVPFGQGPRSAAQPMEVFGENGNLLFRQGGPVSENQGIVKPQVKAIQSDIFDATNTLARLNEIEAAFDPELLQIPGKLENWWNKLKGKWNVSSLSEEERQQVENTNDLMQSSFNHMNLVLKALSGAAVSEHEWNRQKRDLPNPGGDGIFDIIAGDGDDPVTFGRKVKNHIRWTKNAIARWNWYLHTGRLQAVDGGVSGTTPADDPSAPSLYEGGSGMSGMEKIIDETEARLEAKFKEEYGADVDVTPYVADELTRIFGIPF